MNKAKIEWVKNPDGSPGYTWNPIAGCKYKCDYCYAKKLNDRFKFVENWEVPEDVPSNKSIKQLKGFKEHKTVYVGSMTDLFGHWVTAANLKLILAQCSAFQTKHTFLFLTRNPERYLDPMINPFMEWEFAFPGMWRGVTVTGPEDFWRIDKIRSMGRNFVSCEPVLGSMRDINLAAVAWLIIGTLNKDGHPVPEDKGGSKKEDILYLVEMATRLDVPIFIKDEVYEAFPELEPLFRTVLFRQIPYNSDFGDNESKSAQSSVTE